MIKENGLMLLDIMARLLNKEANSLPVGYLYILVQLQTIVPF